jgi:hypothetical protein
MSIKKNTEIKLIIFKFSLLFLKNLIVKFLVGKKACKYKVWLYQKESEFFKKKILLK